MIDKETKDRYINIVDALGDESLASSFREFISTFDGSNDKQFHLLVANFISLLIAYKDLKIKAVGYDEFIESDELTALQIENVKKRFESLSRGEIPVMPVTTAQSSDIPKD